MGHFVLLFPLSTSNQMKQFHTSNPLRGFCFSSLYQKHYSFWQFTPTYHCPYEKGKCDGQEDNPGCTHVREKMTGKGLRVFSNPSAMLTMI